MCVLCSFFVVVSRISCLHGLMNFVILGHCLFRYRFCFSPSQFSWDFSYITVETLTVPLMTTAFPLIFLSFLHFKIQSVYCLVTYLLFYYFLFSCFYYSVNTAINSLLGLAYIWFNSTPRNLPFMSSS